MRLYAVSAAEAAGRNTMRHLLRRTAGALLALFVIAAFAAPHASARFPAGRWKSPPRRNGERMGSAVFIARANGAALFAWRIVSSDGTALYDAAAAPEYFPGLRVQGADTDTLTLLDIPSSLNGWQVECLFTDDAGEKALSGRASLTVYPVGPTGVAGADAHAGRDSHPGAVSDAGDHSLAGANRDPHGLALSRAGNARADGNSRPRRGRAAFAPRGARCVCRSRCARAPSRRALSESPRRRAQRAPA